MFVAIAMMIASVQAQSQIAYLDLYQRGGARHLRTTLMFDGNPVYIGKWNLGEMLNMLAKQGWEIDHTLIGARRIPAASFTFFTRHKFHIILKKEYRTGEDPFTGLFMVEDTGSIANTESMFFNGNGTLSFEKIAPTTINYTAFKNRTISVNINRHPDFESNEYIDNRGIIKFKNTITHIPNKAFFKCLNLDSIIIPESVTEIGDAAFAQCWYLTKFYCQSTIPPTLGRNAFANTPDLIIYVPQTSVNTYKNADGWSKYASKIVGYDF